MVPETPSAGGDKAATTVRSWWNVMLSEDMDGQSRYTRNQLESIVASDPRENSLAKRIAANHVLMMLDGG